MDQLVLENTNLTNQIAEIKGGEKLPLEIEKDIKVHDSLLDFYTPKELQSLVRKIVEESSDKTSLLFQFGKRLGINVNNITNTTIQNLEKQIQIYSEQKKDLDSKNQAIFSSFQKINPAESRTFSSLLKIIVKAKQFIEEFNEESLMQTLNHILSFSEDPILEKHQSLKEVFYKIRVLQESISLLRTESQNGLQTIKENDLKTSAGRNTLMEQLELLESEIKNQEEATNKASKDKSSINSELELINRKIAIFNKMLAEAKEKLRENVGKFNRKRNKENFFKFKKDKKGKKGSKSKSEEELEEELEEGAFD
ncbi:hypothetical protein HE1_00323 [Holospora elegans E1]|uniref:Uncharacterized protein n=1 Tax=Holospora elegans E1 TaxID=1427503 RepID=A0A023DXB8_9PROT|nr:hypothetical protein [Holospora elegans]GAJ46003.1 hypothetical protein HE1_00323 [Holospora elegans E1]